jgi:hypothetical protein
MRRRGKAKSRLRFLQIAVRHFSTSSSEDDAEAPGIPKAGVVFIFRFNPMHKKNNEFQARGCLSTNHVVENLIKSFR